MDATGRTIVNVTGPPGTATTSTRRGSAGLTTIPSWYAKASGMGAFGFSRLPRRIPRVTEAARTRLGEARQDLRPVPLESLGDSVLSYAVQIVDAPLKLVQRLRRGLAIPLNLKISVPVVAPALVQRHRRSPLGTVLVRPTTLVFLSPRVDPLHAARRSISCKFLARTGKLASLNARCRAVCAVFEGQSMQIAGRSYSGAGSPSRWGDKRVWAWPRSAGRALVERANPAGRAQPLTAAYVGPSEAEHLGQRDGPGPRRRASRTASRVSRSVR
jgi:hypothetical protein